LAFHSNLSLEVSLFLIIENSNEAPTIAGAKEFENKYGRER
jgi:hypothetical protein